MTAVTLFAHPDGLGTIEYNDKSQQLVVQNDEHGGEAFASIGPQGLVELAQSLLGLKCVSNYLRWTEHAAQMSEIVKAHGEQAFTDPGNIGMLETMVATAPTSEMKQICSNALQEANFRRVREQMKFIEEKYGTEVALEREDHAALFVESLKFAPPEFMDAAAAEAKKLGLLPSVARVDENGAPVYELNEIAERLGVSEAELLKRAEDLGVVSLLVDSSKTSTLQ